MKLVIFLITIFLANTAHGNEVHCMAKNIYMEARGEPHLGKLLVAGVAINRTKHKDYPNTICKVIAQKGQYKWPNINIPNNKEWVESKMLAKAILDKKVHIPKNFNATHFHSVRVKPVWGQKLRFVTRVGAHVFYVGV